MRAILRIALACLLAAPVIVALPATPAVAAPACGPTGDPPPTEAPWPLRRLDPRSVWPLSRGDGVRVAVIDSGVSATHPVLKGKVLPGRDFGLPNHAGQCDENGHGTMVAAIIAGRDDTGVPFWGVAPGAEILPIRVMRNEERSLDEALPGRIAEAIRYAVAQDADVVNLSLETDPTPELERAIQEALEKNVVVVAAAGNRAGQQGNRRVYPAAYEGVLAVGGIDEQGNHVNTSMQGDYIDVAAPGLMIQGPAPRGNGYRVVPEGGTSYAAAYVSGVVALVRARYPDLTASQVVWRVTRTADRPPEGRNNRVGYGVVNPYQAVAAVTGTKSHPPAETLDPAPTPPDPLATTKVVAVWTAVGGTLVAALLLASMPIIRSGRRRGWRPGPVRPADRSARPGSTAAPGAAPGG